MLLVLSFLIYLATRRGPLPSLVVPTIWGTLAGLELLVEISYFLR